MTKAWYECVVWTEDDEQITIDCLVDTIAERDPYGTGDSPTLYETYVVRAEYEGNPIALSAGQEEEVEEQVINQLSEDMIYGQRC